jgi:hypothetical protein
MLKTGTLLLSLQCILLVGAYWWELMDVNACLESGGSFDYINSVCSMSEKFEFVSYSIRHPWLVNGGLLVAMVGLVMTTLGMLQKGMATPKDDA